MRIVNNMKSYTTSDLPVAAYLMMKGLSLVRAERLSGRFIFELDDTDLDILSIKISDKLIGTVGTMPRDAYEVQTFKNTIN